MAQKSTNKLFFWVWNRTRSNVRSTFVKTDPPHNNLRAAEWFQWLCTAANSPLQRLKLVELIPKKKHFHSCAVNKRSIPCKNLPTKKWQASIPHQPHSLTMSILPKNLTRIPWWSNFLPPGKSSATSPSVSASAPCTAILSIPAGAAEGDLSAEKTFLRTFQLGRWRMWRMCGEDSGVPWRWMRIWRLEVPRPKND